MDVAVRRCRARLEERRCRGAVSYTHLAVYKRQLVDEEKCIGCKYCMAACPYGAPIVQEKTGVVEKCRFCLDCEKPCNPPACVGTCISGARIFGDLDDPDSEINQAIAKYHSQPLADNLTVSKIYYVR